MDNLKQKAVTQILPSIGFHPTDDGISKAHAGCIREPNTGPSVLVTAHDGEVDLVSVLVELPLGKVFTGFVLK